MEYLTAHYWQQENTGTSLVLQHLMYRKEKMPMLFASVCTEQGGTGEGCFMKQLNDWFQQKGREVLRRDKGEVLEQTEEIFRRAFADLEEQWRQYTRKTGREQVLGPSVCGMFCVDKRFLLFYRGRQNIFLLNTRFERASYRVLSGEGESQKRSLSTSCGILEPKIGILLATEFLGDKLSERQLCECLSSKELSSSQRLQKRLNELGDEAARQGARRQAAVLMVTQ